MHRRNSGGARAARLVVAAAGAMAVAGLGACSDSADGTGGVGIGSDFDAADGPGFPTGDADQDGAGGAGGSGGNGGSGGIVIGPLPEWFGLPCEENADCEDGWCVQDTYDALRERLFPLSLIYSSFAHARFRIEAQPARAA